MSASLSSHKDTTSAIEDSYMDDLEDYDFPDIDISLQEIREPTKPTESRGTRKKDSLGIDDEVRVKKKRINVKLDETRLLGPSGIPKLRKDVPKLKFKGKGHEYRDTARLLSYYQLWADDLFRKAKFRDTLNIIEKLGHTRMIRNERVSWIQESKKEKDRAAEIIDENTEEQNGQSEITDAVDNRIPRDDNNVQRDEEPSRSSTVLAPADDRALFLGDDESDDGFGGAPDDTELDALMNSANMEDAQATATKDNGPKPNDKALPPRDEFDDEMEAMAGMDFDFE